jgi:hypothetical protein
MNMPIQRPVKKIAPIVTACVLAAFSVPVQAYNLGYTNIGYSMLYPLTNLAYGPYYILNRVMMQNVYSPYGYSPYGGKFGGLGNSSYGYNNLNNLSGNQNFSNYNNQNSNQGNWNRQGYTNPSGNYSQQANSNQQGNLNQNGNANSNSYQDPFAPVQQPYNTGQPGSQQIDANSGRSAQPNPSQVLASGGGSFPPGAASVPSPAPNRYGGRQQQQPDQGAFAGEFLNVLSNKYHGDAARAFKDNDVRAWAQALNIPIPDNGSLEKMGHVRKQAITSVLRDNSLDSSNKLDALRILLH